MVTPIQPFCLRNYLVSLPHLYSGNNLLTTSTREQNIQTRADQYCRIRMLAAALTIPSQQNSEETLTSLRPRQERSGEDQNRPAAGFNQPKWSWSQGQFPVCLRTRPAECLALGETGSVITRLPLSNGQMASATFLSGVWALPKLD